MYTLAHHRQGFAGCELAGVPQRTARSGDPPPWELYFDYLPCLRVVWATLTQRAVQHQFVDGKQYFLSDADEGAFWV